MNSTYSIGITKRNPDELASLLDARMAQVQMLRRLSQLRHAPRVLLVDDDPVFRLDMARIANREQIPLTFCCSLRELGELGKWRFDIALVDLDLRSPSPETIATLLKKAYSGISLVFVADRSGAETPFWHAAVPRSRGPYGIFAAAIEAYQRASADPSVQLSG